MCARGRGGGGGGDGGYTGGDCWSAEEVKKAIHQTKRPTESCLLVCVCVRVRACVQDV